MTDTRFPSKTYLVWRKEIEIANLTDQSVWQTAFGTVGAFAQANGLPVTGPGSALYFRWDEPAGRCEIGIGLPVETTASVNDASLSLVRVGESAATTETVRGGYDRLRQTHAALQASMQERGLTPTIVIEEYAVTGMQKPDPKDWETNVYYLHT